MEVRCRTSIAGMPKVEGYLEKRGKFNLKCMWKKYWFVLDGKSLLYFKSKDSYESLGVCKGMIDFSRVQVIRIPAKLKHGFPFEIVTRSQIIYLSANDNMTRDVWIEELRHALRPPQISDPFNTTKVSAPHLSKLFEQVCCDPRGNKENSINENAPLPKPTKFPEENTITEECAETDKIKPFNEESSILETDYIDEQCPSVISSTISSQKSTVLSITSENLEENKSVVSEDIPVLLITSENLEQTKYVVSEDIPFKVSSVYANQNHQTTDESDGTDDGNEGSNYETAEEMLENENYFDKTVRQSYGLPYPIAPEFDLSIYCELKEIINCIENKDASINKLGKSVAVEAMKNFLHESEK